jgi:hypothetical protein
MAWRCRFLAARPSEDGRAIAEKRLSEELSGAPDALVDFHTASSATGMRNTATSKYDKTAHLTRPNLSMVANKRSAPASSLVKMAKIVQNLKRHLNSSSSSLTL